ncbi:MAG: ATP-binding protein [Deltaproteobacteria bacterium]|nr:ATP-binding protein [Deltaproteobacteria bacterium]
MDRRTGVPIFATGISSFHLESRTRESLAGRAIRYQMLPLSLSEITQNAGGTEILILRNLKDQMEKMLCYGGYPRVVLEQDPVGELAGLVESFIIRDASDRFRVRYPAAFRKVLELAASQIGNLCNFSEWSAHAGVSNDTVSEYTHLLQETHVVRLVRPFVGGKRAEITSAPKVYFIDNGIRNIVFGGFQPVHSRPDRGALWENFAFTEIYKS